MGLSHDIIGVVIAAIVIWIIIPDPIPVVDEMILIPVVTVLVAKFIGDLN